MVTDAKAQCDSGHRLPPKLSFSVNGQVIAGVFCDVETMRTFGHADYLDADGMSLVFASKAFHREPLRERVATTDFFRDCVRAAGVAGLSFYMLGGTEEHSAAGCAKIVQDHPGIRIAGRHHGYFNLSDLDTIAEEIRTCRPDVVWVGMGFPRQERVALALRARLVGVTWIKTCGGLLDHVLGIHPRAPAWVQALGFEWLHRLLHEPKRLGWRYITTNPVAFWHLLSKTR